MSHLGKPSKRRTVALLGLRGAGKTTLGRLAAQKLGCVFEDTDEWLAREAQRAVGDLLEEHGEEHFRDLEQRLLTRLLGEDLEAVPRILATGGGICERPANRALLYAHTHRVWIAAPPAVLVVRVARDPRGRPALAGSLDDPVAECARLLARRSGAFHGLAERVLHVPDAAVSIESAASELADLTASWVL